MAEVADIPVEDQVAPDSSVADVEQVEQPVIDTETDAPPGEEQNNKRKFEDDTAEEETDGPMRKRASFEEPEAAETNGNAEEASDPAAEPAAPAAATEPASGVDSAASAEAFYDCPAQLVGKLIGRQGATIQELQARTETKIQVDHKTPGDNKKVHITGTAAAVENAKALIKEVLESEAPVLGGDISKTVSCPPGIVGRIIGKGGETIRSLQQGSGAHIVVDQNFPEGVDRQVNVSGRADAVERAYKMITELISGGPGSAQAIIQKHGVGVTRTLECTKSIVGRIIGKAGETIKGIQKQTMANVQIDQTSDPCKITVSGRREAVEHAMHLLNDIIRGANNFGDFQGPPNGPGGSFNRPGNFGQQPYQQFPPSGPGYPGAFPYAPPAAAPAAYGYYGAPAAYAPAYPAAAAAAAPQQQYGGYQGYGAAADPYQSGFGAAPQAAATPSVWQEQHDDQGRPYYYNTQTGASQWEKPADMA